MLRLFFVIIVLLLSLIPNYQTLASQNSDIVEVVEEDVSELSNPRGTPIENPRDHDAVEIIVGKMKTNTDGCSRISNIKAWKERYNPSEQRTKGDWAHIEMYTVEVQSNQYDCDYISSGNNKDDNHWVNDSQIVITQNLRSTYEHWYNDDVNKSAWVIKETRAWWTRTDKGVNENWYPDDVVLRETLAGYNCYSGDGVVENKYTNPFTPRWNTSKLTYHYYIDSLSDFDPTIPENAEGLRTFSAVETQKVMGNGKQWNSKDWVLDIEY